MEPLSERLGSPTRAQLQAALDRFDLGRLVDVRPTTAGLFGQNAFLTSDSGEWVFRGGPHWPWQFAKERFFCERLNQSTSAPVPWPYQVEESEELFGWSYALMPRLPGTRPPRLGDALSLEDGCAIADVLGDGLAELHCLSAPEPGEYDPEKRAIRPETPFRDWAIRSLLDWQAKVSTIAGALDDADLELIRNVVDDARDALGEPFEPCFVHYDYHEGNVLVENGEGGWRLSGVFDLMTCAFGDGEQDLSRLVASLASPEQQPARRFIAAYRARRPFRPGFLERFRFYMLMDRLVLWEYGRRNELWFPKQARFRDFARGYLALDSLLDD